jgi:orotidine-5'-phosphate decarboxylase
MTHSPRPASPSEAGRRVAVALDLPTLDEARTFAAEVAPHIGVIKVGLELFVRFGPRAVEALAPLGRDVFLDLKLHDIPETVGRAVAQARELGVRYLTVHAGGGPAMLRAATEAAGDELTILAVTVLTSLSHDDLRAIGVERPPLEQALGLARMATDAGVRGFVTSAHEVGALRAALPEAVLVTPGIRPAGAASGDQKRVATPASAIASGASLLVVGRPLRDAADPRAAAAALEAEIASALEAR